MRTLQGTFWGPAAPRGRAGDGLQAIAARRSATAVLVFSDDPMTTAAVAAGLPNHAILSGPASGHAPSETRVIAAVIEISGSGRGAIEAAHRVRGDSRWPELPLLFIVPTGHDPTGLFETFGQSAIDCLAAPIKPVVLAAKIRLFAMLDNRAQAQRGRSKVTVEHFAIASETAAAAAQRGAILQRQQIHHALMLDALPIAFYRAALESPRRLSFVDDRIRTVSGYGPAHFTAAPDAWAQHVHPDDRDRVAAALLDPQRAPTLILPYRWIGPGGREHHILDHSMLTEDAGQAAEIVGFWLDISERRQLEDDLTEVRKHEAVGRMTGGIAHDVNNMLGIIGGSLELVKGAVAADAAAQRRLKDAMKGVRHCAGLTRRLMSFGRSAASDAEAIDLGRFLPDMADFIRTAVGAGIAVKIAADPRLKPVRVDPVRLQAALLNLAINARDAMEGSGTLTLRAANRDLQDDVQIEVSDTGAGMPPEVLARVFQPYFTTKEPGRGTGLGLPMVREFVSDAGGSIVIESNPGLGTVIRLTLPAAPQP